MNAKMPELKRAFEAAGFTGVRTVISSGNVVFDARRASESSLQQRSEKAMAEHLGQAFLTIVRPVEMLREMLASDPYREFGLDPSAKRIVTFLRGRADGEDGTPGGAGRRSAGSPCAGGSSSVPTCRPQEAPVFRPLIERTFGKELTTRTWDTVGKVARA